MLYFSEFHEPSSPVSRSIEKIGSNEIIVALSI